MDQNVYQVRCLADVSVDMLVAVSNNPNRYPASHAEYNGYNEYNEKFDIAVEIYKQLAQLKEKEEEEDNEKYIGCCIYWLFNQYKDYKNNPFLYAILPIILNSQSLIIQSIGTAALTNSLHVITHIEFNNLNSAVNKNTMLIDFNKVYCDLKLQMIAADEITERLANIVLKHHNNQTDSVFLPSLVSALPLETLTDILDSAQLNNEISSSPTIFHIYDTCLMNIPNGSKPMVLARLKRAKATMPMADYLHKVVVNSITNPMLLDNNDIREWIYEFVEFNLVGKNTGSYADVDLSAVGLLAVLINSLYSKGVLQPTQDYQALFSSFVKWIGLVPEAAKVYQLSLVN